MNSFDFWKAIGDIDDSFVFEVKELKKGRKAMRGIPFVMKGAACLLLLIGLALFWQSNRNYQQSIKSGEERGMDENAVISEKERGMDKNTVISEKESGEGNNSASTHWDHEMPADEMMENLRIYLDSPDKDAWPDWFGDYYLENDTVYVLLVENNETNQDQVKEWAGSDNIVFKKADFSFNYLNEVIAKVFQGMESGEFDFIDLMTLDSQANRIKMETKRDISDSEKEALSLCDTQGRGSAFIINTSSHEVPEADPDIKYKDKQPLTGVNSQVTMTAKMKKDVLVLKVKNKSGRTIYVDADHLLYRKNNGRRKRISSLRYGEDASYVVEKGKTYTVEIKLSDEYGNLESGAYVIEKEVSIKGSRVVMSAEFEIKQPLVGINSKVIMTAKMKKDVLAIKVENKSGREMLVSGEHILYRKNNGKRERIEYLPKVEVPDWVQLIEKDKVYTDKIKLSDVFGELESGEYVIEKRITVEGSEFVVSAEFEIK